MQIIPQPPIGCFAIKPHFFSDDRGWFMESWNARNMVENGLAASWVQDNHSRSKSKGTLRGLHYQAPPHAQAKLVRCTRGAIMDAAIDIRVGSPTYLQHAMIELTEDNGLQLFIPGGFMHGFITLVDGAEVQYKCTEFYAPDSDRTIRWDDPQIGLDWGLSAPPILSEKDADAPFLEAAPSPFSWSDGA